MIVGMIISFNNKPANPIDLVYMELGLFFEDHYIMISDLTHTDKKGLDDILEFIEGKKDDKTSQRKKKKKAKKQSSNSDGDETFYQNLLPSFSLKLHITFAKHKKSLLESRTVL